MENLSFVG